MFRIQDQWFFKLRTNAEQVIRLEHRKGEKSVWELKMMNLSTQRVVWRVKVTDNGLVELRPPCGFLDPEEETTVQLLFAGNQSATLTTLKMHHLAIFHCPFPHPNKIYAAAAARDPEEQWNQLQAIWRNSGQGNTGKKIAAFYEALCASRYFLLDLIDLDGRERPKKKDEFLEDLRRGERELCEIADEQENDENEHFPRKQEATGSKK